MIAVFTIWTFSAQTPNQRPAVRHQICLCENHGKLRVLEENFLPYVTAVLLLSRANQIGVGKHENTKLSSALLRFVEPNECEWWVG